MVSKSALHTDSVRKYLGHSASTVRVYPLSVLCQVARRVEELARRLDERVEDLAARAATTVETGLEREAAARAAAVHTLTVSARARNLRQG